MNTSKERHGAAFQSNTRQDARFTKQAGSLCYARENARTAGFRRRRQEKDWAVSPEAALFLLFLELCWPSPVWAVSTGVFSGIRQSFTVFFGWRKRIRFRKRRRRFLHLPLQTDKSKRLRNGGGISNRR